MTSVCASFLFAAPRRLLMCCASWSALARRRPASGPARSFKKRAHRRLKAWMRACAPNVCHTARLGICRHKAKWSTAGTLPDSPATITGPWRTRRIFANHLRGTNFTGQTSSPSICYFGRFPKKSLFARFSGRRSKSNFLGNCHMQQHFSHNVHCH